MYDQSYANKHMLCVSLRVDLFPNLPKHTDDYVSTYIFTNSIVHTMFGGEALQDHAYSRSKLLTYSEYLILI